MMVVISSFSPPTEGIRHEQPFTALCMGSRELGKGTLFITESCLSWVNTATGQGFSLEYPHIALHAVSKDLRAYPHECLYVMVDTKIDGDQEPRDENTNEDDSGGESDPDLTELRFVPEDKGMLEAMFHAVRECQALHPDAEDSFSDDDFVYGGGDEDEEGEYQLGGGDGPIIVSNRRSTNGVSAEEEPMEMDIGQFEDAEGEPEH